MTSVKYKPHIDGLRAVAVLLVILHHLGDWIGTRGGFVGVDVFFVISGFLITSVVRSDVEEGRFTIGGFYKRRIVRLAPAFFVVLLATTAAALVWMLPAELMAYAESMIASSLFLANFHMWKEVGGYFGGEAEAVPLLHLWSLAVEEQFYLLWPFVLLIGHRFLSSQRIFWAVVAVALLGALASQLGVESAPAASYYLLPTRFFELAIGASLAYLPVSDVPRKFANWFAVAGLALIVYAAVTYGEQTPFPGYMALLPTLGTAMLLRFSEGTFIGTGLSRPAATMIGRISYPAYLWHWPILVFLHINEVTITVWVGMGVLAATFIFSWLTHVWLELPARRFLPLPPWCVAVFGAGLPIAAVVAVSIGIILLNGFPSRFPESLNQKSEALHAFASKARGSCNSALPSAPAPPEDCVLGRSDGNVNILLVGDSHANHFSGFVDVLAKDAQLRGYDLTQSNTPFLPNVDLAMLDEPEYNGNFRPRNEYVSGLLQRERYEVVVLAGAYENFFNSNMLSANGVKGPVAFEQGMRAAIRESSSAAARVIVFASIPELEVGFSDCGLRAVRFDQKLDCTIPAKRHVASSLGVRSFFQRLKLEFPEVVWVEADLLICDDKRCLTEIDGVPLYKDEGHLNDVGSRLLAKKWLQRFGNPLVGDARQRVGDSESTEPRER